MQNCLIRKLVHGAALTEGDRTLLNHLVRRTRAVEPHRSLVAEGESPPRILVMLEGWACRSKLLSAG
ncbi:hypothetical protein ACRAWG_12880 [Methylobacterium sp. P31]